MRSTSVLALALLLTACGASAPTRPAASGASDRTAVPAAAPAAASLPAGGAEPAHERAVDAMRAGRWLEAELALEQLVAAYPDYPGAYANLAIVYREDGRTAEAAAMLERAIALEPRHPEANNTLGIVRREQGRFDDAERAYRSAIDAQPDYALAHYNLAVLLDVYLQRGAEALEHYQRYQALLAVPDQNVGRWIIDLRRRLGISDDNVRLARGDGS